MSISKPRQPKALWYRAQNGTAPTLKKLRRIRPVSKIRSKRLRVYALQAALWKLGRACECIGVRHGGKLVCSHKMHLCSEVHHRNGRIGALLLDTNSWVALCAKAHRFTHDHPEAAKALGLLGAGPWNTQPK